LSLAAAPAQRRAMPVLEVKVIHVESIRMNVSVSQGVSNECRK
jgi:hypothetical protein